MRVSLCGVGTMTGRALEAALQREPEFRPGHVWLIGAGPGDPGLLTLHALAGIEQADVLVHDALVSPCILDLARPDATLVLVGKRGGRPAAMQADISSQLVTLARQRHR